VNGVADRLGDRANVEGIEGLGPQERTVLLPWWLKGIVDNGGFKYFYEGATETLAVAEAFDALGLSEAAAACRQAHARVPEEMLDRGFEACREWMDTLDEDALEELFSEPDRVIWDLEESLEKVLAAYIRTHGLLVGS
jgi:hypothetical protein